MRICLVCRHKDHLTINRLLLERVPYRSVAKQFGMSRSAIHRHRRDHMKAAFEQAAQREAANESYRVRLSSSHPPTRKSLD